MNNIERKEINNIKLEEIGVPFSNGLMKHLQENNVNTLKDFLEYADNEIKTKGEKLKDYSADGIHKELLGTAKILRCKYLGEDPKIKLESTSIYEELRIIGFSHGLFNALNRYTRRHVEEFRFENHRDLTLEEYLEHYMDKKLLLHVQNLGQEKAKEYIAKTTIILDYYKDKKRTLIENEGYEDSQELTELVRVNEELKELLKQKEALDNKINQLRQRQSELQKVITKK